MKKIIELEDRWKAYKYRKITFYIFIIVLILFILCLGFFLKVQYDRYYAKSSLVKDSRQQYARQEGRLDNTIKTSNASIALKNDILEVKNAETIFPSISFVCRKVTADKLTVRKEASFKSQPVGYYSKDSVFCASNKNVNGLLQTNNGWVSARDNYSHIVEVNMFVDSGFYKYSSQPRQVAESPIEEIKVFDNKPESSPKIATNTQATEISQAPINTPIQKPKPHIQITSEKITKERAIQLKEADFVKSNDYNTAIEIAEYYFAIKDYKNSLKWAYDASNVASNTPKTQSWIIYAKSLYASGKKDQAIKVLDNYIAKTNSKDAIDVLNKMKQGII